MSQSRVSITQRCDHSRLRDGTTCMNCGQRVQLIYWSRPAQRDMWETPMPKSILPNWRIVRFLLRLAGVPVHGDDPRSLL